jgi:DNA-binding MarR family transcriptional regulator
VSLEPKGLKLIAAHAPYSEEMYAEIAERFGAERIEQLISLLQELEASLQEVPQRRTQQPRKGRVPS